MAAINKNFVVKNGIEVGDNLIYGDKANLKVGIGTTVPGYTLDVRGGIGATSVSIGQTLTANVGVITTLNATNTNFGESIIFRTGIGTELNVSGIVTAARLNVTGIATFNSSIGVVGVVTTKELDVVGIATIQTLNVQTQLDVYDSQAIFHNDVYVAGNLSIGGTTIAIIAQDLRVSDRDIVLGVTTDAFGGDISNDTTANHGGIAIASTEGSPLVNLELTGFTTLPNTYKQLMWVKGDSYGFGTTDAWMFNYAVGIGSTLVPNGVRLAVSEIQFTDNTINTPNINIAKDLKISGVGTFLTLDSTWIRVGSGITFRTGIGTNLFVSGVGTITTLNATGAAVTASRSTWQQVGSGLTFTTGIGTNFTVSGVGTVTQLVSTNATISGISSVGSLSIGSTQVISSTRQLQNIASLDATTTATIEAAIVNAPNTFSDLIVTGIATFNSSIGVVGIVTVGSGVTIFPTGDARYVGIITAQKFVGDGSSLTGTISGIGIRSEGADIGYGATILDFRGPGVSTVTAVSVGIATIFFEGGGSGSIGIGTSFPSFDNANGDLFYNANYGRLFVYYDESVIGVGTDAFWVDAAPFNVGVITSLTNVSFLPGSVTSPSMYFVGDSQTGFFSPGTGELTIVSSGSSILNVNPSGLVVTGIITAQKFVGDGSELTGTISGVGVQSAGTFVGTGITTLNFAGSALTSITVSGNTATITLISGSGGGGTPGGSQGQVQYNDSSAFTGSANFTFDGSNVKVGGALTVTEIDTTWQSVGLGLTFRTGIATNFTVSGVGTITTLNATGAAVTALRSTWEQVGLGLTFRTGIATNFTVSGVGTVTQLVSTNITVSGITTVGSISIGSTQVISSARQLQNITSLDATTTAAIEAAIVNAPNTFSDLIVTGIATFNNNVGVAGIVTVGSGVTIVSTGDARYAGIITAQKFVGDGSGLTGVGIGSTGSINTVGIITCRILSNASLLNYSEPFVNIGNTGSAITLGLSTSGYFIATLNQTTTFTFNSTGIPSQYFGFALQLKNGTGGPFSITWPASIYWPDGGSTPSRTTIDSRTDIWSFTTTNGGTTWLGNLAILNYTV